MKLSIGDIQAGTVSVPPLPDTPDVDACLASGINPNDPHAPRIGDRLDPIRIVELFSCAGGMAEGFRRAGLPVTLALDWDDDACWSYSANHHHWPVRLDVRELVRLLSSGASLGPVDLLIADPPCTPWSRAGLRLGSRDARDMLGPTCDLITLVRPRAWLVANVPGLDDAPSWPSVQRWLGSIPGYVVDFFRLDAADYGVPQHRIRPFWFGRPPSSAPLAAPIRSHGPSSDVRTGALFATEALLPYVTCRQALSHLVGEDLGSPIRLRWRGGDGVGSGPRASHMDAPAGVVTTKAANAGDGTVLFDGPNHRPSQADEPARTLTRNTHGDGALIVVPHHPPSEFDSPSRTVRATSATTPDKVLTRNSKHPVNAIDAPSATVTARDRGAQGAGVLDWPWDTAATTITADPNGRVGPPGHHGKSFLSSPNAVKLSEKAAAVLQGFPDGWVFHGATKRSRWSQIGMAMPPPLAEVVARSIRKWFAVERLPKSVEASPPPPKPKPKPRRAAKAAKTKKGRKK